MTTIIGIDPGSRHTGYGIICGEGSRVRHLASGTIHVPPRHSLPQRLGFIHSRLGRIIDEWKPVECAVEDVFFSKNARSALVLGQARGAAVLAGINAGLEIFEYSPLQIKQAVVGYGRAEKGQVMQMMKVLLGLRVDLNEHAADALAVAICHWNSRAISRLVRDRKGH